MGKKKEKVDKKEYNKFIDGLSLQGLKLISSEARVDEGFSPPAEIELEDKKRYDVIDDDNFAVYMEYDLVGTSGENGDLHIRIKSTYKVTYKTKIPITDKIFEVFSQTSLVLQVWPYFRQLIQDITGKMGLPPLVLDVMKLSGAT